VNLSTTDSKIILPGKNNIILPVPSPEIQNKKQNKHTRQRLKNMFVLLSGWGLELPTIKTISSKEWLKFQGSLLSMVEQLDKQGVCHTARRGALTLTEFKAVYKDRLQSLQHSSKPAENQNKKKEKWTTRAVPKGQSLTQQEYYQQDLALVRERRKKRNSERLRREKHKIKLKQRKEFKLFVAHLVKWQLPPPTAKIMQSKIFCKALPRLIIMTKQLITSSYCRAKNGNVLDLNQFKDSYIHWILSIENTVPTAKKSTLQKIKDSTTAGVNRVLALQKFIKTNESINKVFSGFILKTLRPLHSAREPP
jgi:phage terminase Nu1 subunit (DNA packaging protein)